MRVEFALLCCYRRGEHARHSKILRRRAKGYGFIDPDDQDLRDVFLHKSALRDPGVDANLLLPGTRLEFDTEEGREGQQAVNVRIL